MKNTEHTHPENQLTDATLPAFCLILSIFIGGLILNTIIGTKIVNVFGFYMPAGIFLWSLTFPLTDIITETYGRKYALYFVIGGFIVSILSIVMVYLAIWLPAAPFWKHEDAYNTILGANIRTIMAMILSFIVAQTTDIYIFSWIQKKTNGRFLWLRNNCSTLFSQFLANCIFLSIAFWGTINPDAWVMLFITNMIGRITLAVIDTPMVYAGVHIVRHCHPSLKRNFCPNMGETIL